MHIPVNRRSAAATLVAGLFGVLAALPTTSASASASRDANPLSLSTAKGASLGSPNAASYELDRLLTPTEVQKLLSGLPIGTATGEITPEALAKALASLPALQGLKISSLEASLKSTLEGLGSGATLTLLQNPTSLVSNLATTVEKLLDLEELLKLGGLLGGESLSKKLEGALLNVNVSELLPGLLGSSASPQALLEKLLSGMPTSLVEEILGSKLSGSPAISVTVSELAADLGITVETLLKELGETAAQLPETKQILLDPLANGELLSVLDGTNRVVLGTLSALLDVKGSEGSKGSEETKGTEGSKKTEESKGTEGSKGTEETKGAEGSKGTEGSKTTEETKDSEGSKGSEESKGTESGKATEEAKKTEESKDSEGSNGDKGEGTGGTGPGGTGSSGGSSSDGGSGLTTLNVNIPSTSTTPGTTTTVTPATSKKALKKTTGKIVVLKYTVHDFVATILARAPGAGKLTVRDKDVGDVDRYVDGGRDLSFDVVLSKDGAAAARHGHAHSLGVKLRIVFTPTDGVRSHAILKLRFR